MRPAFDQSAGRERSYLSCLTPQEVVDARSEVVGRSKCRKDGW
jgi:hypothetical protein